LIFLFASIGALEILTPLHHEITQTENEIHNTEISTFLPPNPRRFNLPKPDCKSRDKNPAYSGLALLSPKIAILSDICFRLYLLDLSSGKVQNFHVGLNTIIVPSVVVAANTSSGDLGFFYFGPSTNNWINLLEFYSVQNSSIQMVSQTPVDGFKNAGFHPDLGLVLLVENFYHDPPLYLTFVSAPQEYGRTTYSDCSFGAFHKEDTFMYGTLDPLGKYVILSIWAKNLETYYPGYVLKVDIEKTASGGFSCKASSKIYLDGTNNSISLVFNSPNSHGDGMIFSGDRGVGPKPQISVSTMDFNTLTYGHHSQTFPGFRLNYDNNEVVQVGKNTVILLAGPENTSPTATFAFYQFTFDDKTGDFKVTSLQNATYDNRDMDPQLSTYGNQLGVLAASKGTFFVDLYDF